MEENSKSIMKAGDTHIKWVDENGIKREKEIMIESKYYTPTIEELYIGAEFESNLMDVGGMFLPNGEVIPPGVPVWSKEVFSTYHFDKFLSAYDFKGVLEDKRIRVKHLDKEDIESLGFEYDGKRDEYCKGNVIIEFNGKTHITIGKYEEDFPMGEYTSWTDDLFIGTIKNKSELKRILKQIGV